MRFNDNLILEDFYGELLEEGIEQKIPKLLNFVPDNIEDKESYIMWAAEIFDPSKNAAYITWILRMLKKGVLAGEEDGPKVRERLEQFTQLKKKPQFPQNKRDINSFKTYGDLAETIDEFSGIQTKGEQIRAAREEGIEFVDEIGGTKLYIVTTSEAGAKYFRQTDWCVKDPRYFDQYGAPYYFFTDSDDQPQTLLHLDSNQCMDVRDRDTELTEEEKELMSSEKITRQVIDDNNSASSLGTYYQRVGPGYDDEVEQVFIGQAEEALEEANKSLEMFDIGEFDIYDEIKYWRPSAWGHIEYDMSPYEEHVQDRDFLEIVSGVLQDFDIYTEDFVYNEPIADDLSGINVSMEYEESPYESESIADKIVSFGNELFRLEQNFDIEEFDEKFKEAMVEHGYISSDWGDVSNRVEVDKMGLEHFETGNMNPRTGKFDHEGGTYVSKQETLNPNSEGHPSIVGSYDINKSWLRDYEMTDHPFVAFAKFLLPLLDNGIQIHISPRADWITFYFVHQYDEDKNRKQYMKELKTLKAFDTHYDFYLEQIRKFFQQEVAPYLTNGDQVDQHGHPARQYGLPEDRKLPIIQIKGRKDSPDQMMLDLHENRFLRYLKKNGFEF